MARKIPISLRVNPETLEWFKGEQPKGYQTLMNSLLDDYVTQQKLSQERLLGRAQELYKQFYAQCFWHYRKDLEITKENLPLVIDGLKKFGGVKGVKIAQDLCL